MFSVARAPPASFRPISMNDLKGTSKMRNLSLRELRMQLTSTKGQPLPSAKALRECGDMVVASARFGRDSELCVYRNGFFLYKALGRTTVGAVDRCDGMVSGHALDASLLEDEDWTIRLMLEGEERLEHNNDKRHGSTFSYSCDCVEREDMRDSFDLEEMVTQQDLLARALACLTDKQRQAVELVYFQGMSQTQAQETLHIARGILLARLDGARKKIVEIFQ